MAYAKVEQETFLHRSAEEPGVFIIETNEYHEINRVLSLAEEGAWTILAKEVEDDKVISVRAKANTEDFSISFQPRRKRKMSDEEKQAARERLAAARAKQ